MVDAPSPVLSFHLHVTILTIISGLARMWIWDLSLVMWGQYHCAILAWWCQQWSWTLLVWVPKPVFRLGLFLKYCAINNSRPWPDEKIMTLARETFTTNFNNWEWFSFHRFHMGLLRAWLFFDGTFRQLLKLNFYVFFYSKQELRNVNTISVWNEEVWLLHTSQISQSTA